MDTRLALIPDKGDLTRGLVKPVVINNGSIIYGLSVGHYTTNTPDGNTHIILLSDVDTIIHEVATKKNVTAELRGSKKDVVVIKPIITYNPKTKRFKEVIPERR